MTTVNEIKYKVNNTNVSDYGLKLPTRDLVIRANSFGYLTEEEIYHVHSISPTFTKAYLTIEDEDMNKNLGIYEENPNADTEEDFKKILSMPTARMKKALENVKEEHAVRKIVVAAKSMDLAQSKLKFLKDTYGVDIFEDLGEEVI